jgi:hypothetical protein
MSALHNDYQAVPTNSVVLVTPQMANDWLLTNNRNRNISKVRVAKIVDDIINYRWQYNGESIKFDVDGNLIDGQHRLLAIAQSERSLPLLIVNNLATESQQTIDLGRPRTLNDIVNILNIPHSSKVAAIGNMVLQLENNPNIVWSERSLATKALATEFIRSTTSKLVAAAILSSNVYRAFHLREAVYGTFAYKVKESKNYAMFELFHQGLVEGANLSHGDPRLALRNQIMRSPVLANGRWQSQQQLAWTIKAWNGFIENKSMTRMRFGQDNLPMPTIN